MIWQRKRLSVATGFYYLLQLSTTITFTGIIVFSTLSQCKVVRLFRLSLHPTHGASFQRFLSIHITGMPKSLYRDILT